MLNQLIQFVRAQQQSPDLMTLGLRPKTGLHIELRLTQGDGTTAPEGEWYLDTSAPQVAYFDGKSGLTDFLELCAARIANGWCVNTNKCYDLPKKGAHSCSPYLLGMKMESLPRHQKEGEKADAFAKRKYEKDSPKLFDRLEGYFSNAYETVDEAERERLRLFERFVRDEHTLMFFLKGLAEWEQVGEKDYIILYLAEPLQTYTAAHRQYLASRLFNTNDFNADAADGSGEVYGTPDFFTGYNTKKPYLQHLTGPSLINTRISSADATALYEFQQLMGRGIFPRPLLIFENTEEAEALNVKYGELVQREYGEKGKVAHRTIVRKLLEGRFALARANFLLVYYYGGQILDYGHVSGFQYELDKEWRVSDTFGEMHRFPKDSGALYTPLSDVFDLEDRLVPVLFDNELVQVLRDKKDRTKVSTRRRYFDALEPKYFKSAVLFQLVSDHRLAFYNYIYKSQRNAVTGAVFRRILLRSIRDGIRRDTLDNGYSTQERYLLQKLNLLFSLYGHFDGDYAKSERMKNLLNSVPQHLSRVLDTETDTGEHVETPEQYAYLAGQATRYLFGKMNTDKNAPHHLLDPFLNKKKSGELNAELVKLFSRYTHVNLSNRFGTAMSELAGYSSANTDEPVDQAMLLAGYFRYVHPEDRLVTSRNKKEEATA